MMDHQSMRFGGVTRKSLFLISGLFLLVAALLRLYPVVLKNFQGAQSIMKIEQDVPKGNSHWDRAEALLQQIKNEKDLEKIKQMDSQIVQELKQVLVDQPNNPRVWSELGDAYSWVSNLGGDPEVQLAAYKKAEELDPNNPVYIRGVGDQLVTMKRYNDAILELQKALRVGPTDFTYLSLARAYKGAKIYDSARQYYQKTIDGFSSHNSEGKWDADILQAQQEMASLPK